MAGKEGRNTMGRGGRGGIGGIGGRGRRCVCWVWCYHAIALTAAWCSEKRLIGFGDLADLWKATVK